MRNLSDNTTTNKTFRVYVDGLGFAMTRQWVPEGKLQWCWLELGGAALMLQESRKEVSERRAREGKVPGIGVSIYYL
jgi:lactoylglutathione lyase